MNVGDKVEVHNRFDDSWSSGFEVAGFADDGYRLRRVHDDELLPAPTGYDDVRAASPGTAGW